MQSPEEFIGGKGAVEEVAATREERPGAALDDDLDPSGRPYRAGRGADVPDDPRLGGGSYGSGWGRIVRTVFKLDEEKAFADLSDVKFARPPSRLEYGELVDELDKCSGAIVLASQLYENAKVVKKLYEIDLEALRAPMRKQAKKELTDEKVKGAGAITLADIEAKIIEHWPDEHRRAQENLARVGGAVSHCSELLERWKSRARELDGMVRTSRKV